MSRETGSLTNSLRAAWLSEFRVGLGSMVMVVVVVVEVYGCCWVMDVG